jgi:hypothetical protein
MEDDLKETAQSAPTNPLIVDRAALAARLRRAGKIPVWLKEFLGIVVLSSMILLSGIVYVHLTTRGEKDIKKAAAKTEESAESEGTAAKLPERRRFAAIVDNERYRLKAVFMLENEQLQSAIVTIRITPPPPPSEEDIITGRKPDPWLEKVVMDVLEITNHPDSTFLAQGAAKLFIADGGTKKRFQGKGVASGHYDPAARRVTARILINRGFDQVPEQKELIFRPEKEDVLVFLDQEVEARPVRIKRPQRVE